MTESNIPGKKRFSIVNRAQSFTHASRGIWIFLKSTHNAWIHITLLACATALGFYFRIAQMEWLALVLTFGLVLATEAINTAIEFDINLTSPEYHPVARDTKDVAAGAVLISAIAAIIVGLIIFAPRILARL